VESLGRITTLEMFEIEGSILQFAFRRMMMECWTYDGRKQVIPGSPFSNPQFLLVVVRSTRNDMCPHEHDMAGEEGCAYIIRTGSFNLHQCRLLPLHQFLQPAGIPLWRREERNRPFRHREIEA
jgi:hypothetical protein